MNKTTYVLYYGVANAHDDFDGEWSYYCEFDSAADAFAYMQQEKVEDQKFAHIHFFYKIEVHVVTSVMFEDKVSA